MKECPINTSTHKLLYLRIQVKHTAVAETTRSKPKHISKPVWKKCDTELYNSIMVQLLPQNTPIADSRAAIEHLNKSITIATQAAVPFTNPRRRKKPWNPKLGELKKRCKEAHKALKVARVEVPNHDQTTLLLLENTWKRLKSSGKQ